MNKPRSSHVIISILVGVFVAISYVGCTRRSSDNPAIGESMTVVDLQPLNDEGKGITGETLKGKVTFINFWGPWCPPCVQEFPHLVAMNERLQENGDFQLLPVACPPNESWNVDQLRSLTEQFLEHTKATLPIYMDQSGITRSSFELRARQSMGYPTSILVDRKGIIRRVWVGYSPGYEVDMENAVLTLLKQDKTSE